MLPATLICLIKQIVSGCVDFDLGRLHFTPVPVDYSNATSNDKATIAQPKTSVLDSRDFCVAHYDCHQF